MAFACLPLAVGSEPLPSRDLLSSINRQRAGLALTPLVLDARLSQWLELLAASAAPRHEDLTAQRILDHLREHTLEDVAFASVGVFRSDSQEGLSREMRRWRETTRFELTHAAIAGTGGQEGDPHHSWVILLERLPFFEPSLLRENAGRFHHRCALCDHRYNGRFEGGDRLVLVRCPACRSVYDILALDTRGRYERVNRFLSGIDPPMAFPAAAGGKEELQTLWRNVLAHCRYVKDADETTGATSARDSWQKALETFRNRSGDCEDTSILLADWLISRGLDARVAIGATEELAGHAWCVARVDGEEFVLETTFGSRDAASLPTVSESAESYFPEYLFDRDHLYIRKKEHSGWAKSYWSPEAWVAIPYKPSSPPGDELAKQPGAPWIPPLPKPPFGENFHFRRNS